MISAQNQARLPEIHDQSKGLEYVRREKVLVPFRLNLEDFAANRPKGALKMKSVNGACKGTR